MSVSTSNITSDFQRIVLDCYINGAPNSRVTGVEVSMGLSQVNATVTFIGIDWAGAEEGQPCEVWAGYNGQTDIIFRGEIAGKQGRYFPIEQPVTGRDLFARLRLPWGGDDRTYDIVTDADLIRNLLEAMGIGSHLANIEASDLPTLATVFSIVLKQGQPFYPMIDRLDTLSGWRTFTTRDGTIIRRRISGNVGVGTIWSFTEGSNAIAITGPDRTVDGIINQCVVTGLDYESVLIGGPGVAEVRASNPFVPDPPGYIGDPIQDDIIEDDATALMIAKRRVADKNRRPEKITVESVFNPRLVPGVAVAIDAPSLDLDGRYMIDTVRHSIQGSSARTTITTLGGALVNVETNIAPIASFVVQLVQEAADTGSGAVSRIIVTADGTASYDPDGDTLTYLWALSIDAGSITPTAPTTAVASAIISGAATTLSITLTVTDADGATGTIGPQVYPLTRGTLQIEPLYLAWSDGVIEASSDGELTWNASTAGAGATCTAPFAPEWGTIWGGDDGHVRMTIDYLVTAAVDTGALDGTVDVTAVWVHETDTTRAWAGLANGKVFYGVVNTTTPTITWTLAGTIAAAQIYSIREAIGTLGSLRACCGTGYYASEDSGATWTLLHTFTSSNALAMAAGFEQNWASGHNVSSGAIVYAETGTTPTTPGGVDTLAMTMGWRTQAAYGADDAAPANLYSTDSTFAAFTDTTINAPAATFDMIRSGGIPDVIYLACVTGPAKWVVNSGVAPFYIRQRAAKNCLQVGYGPIKLPAAKVDFVFGTFNMTTASGFDGFWRYRFGTYTHIVPPSGTAEWCWLQIVVNPLAPNRWLAYGMSLTDFNTYNFTIPLALSGTATLRSAAKSPLWFTPDAGATWEEVELPESSSDPYAGLYCIGFQDNSGRWIAWGHTLDINGINGTACYWTGTGASDADFTLLSSPAWMELFWTTSGMGGQMLISEADSPGGGTSGRLAYLDNFATALAGETWDTDPVGGNNQPYGPLDTIKGAREFWQINTNGGTGPGIVHWTDYREQDPASQALVVGVPTRANDLSGAYSWVAVGDTHVFFMSNVGGNVGVYRETHATALPAGGVDSAATTAYGCVTDRQSRRVFIGYVKQTATYSFITHDGTAFVSVALPDAAFSTAHAGAGALYKDGRGVPFAAIGEVSIG